MQIKIIAAIFIAMAGVIFAMQNNVPVTVNFLLWRFDSSLALVLLAALAFGAIIVSLLTTPATIRRQWQLMRQKRRIDELERLSSPQKEAGLHPIRPPTDMPSGNEQSPGKGSQDG